MTKAVYAGSFDPITNGHLWMVAEGARLFDELVIALGINPDKKYAIDLKKRLEMILDSTSRYTNVTVDYFENQYLVNYAKDNNVDVILRGIRTGKDYEYEKGMRYINSDLQGTITSVFLIPPRELVEVSSSFVKGLIGPAGWQDIVKRYVPTPVFNHLVSMNGSVK